MARIKSTEQNSRKDIITTQASILFRQKGYRATSMRDLAEKVGVEAASLYNHISSKEELLRDICFKVGDDFTNHLEALEKLKQPAILKIEAIIRFHIKMMLQRFEEVHVSNHDWHHLKEPYHTDFLNRRREYEKRFGSIIEKGVVKKEIRKVNPYIAVLTILSAVRGIEYWHRHKKNVTAAELENNMVQHLILGIKTIE
ncbi:TetR/AcrR family transcriptional regulator [Segetibacter sp. 3557_3]|uniref:TetR/AcrR family transcriptional regulator n=1 Tax=Segetibacter sp. 3557_3 TaxID=2547429 RepID=UPI001058A81F|nr:TetR/AcrR family transcriptional regulator [Segetibacter sp. 3557_3]TDH23058.1 TetR/AcrR family transcriptional regulator [Segetibacter sp. 3557_3]